MNISIQLTQGRRIAEARSMRVNGVPGAGLHVLVILLEFHCYSPPKEVCLRQAHIRLELGHVGQTYVGAAPDDHASIREINEYTGNLQIGFRVPLAPAQIEQIESYRNGGDVDFTLWFFAEAWSDSGVQNVVDKDAVTLSQEEWTRFLSASNYRQVLLYEITRPTNLSDELADIPDMLGGAQTHLLSGRYDECVAKAREIIEVLEESVPARFTSKVLVQRYSEASSRGTMSEEERISFILTAVRHASHLAHHSRRSGFSRDQARAVLGALIAILPALKDIA